MNIKNIILKAQKLEAARRAEVEKDPYKKTISWLYYLGLLRSNTIAKNRQSVTLSDVLRAGTVEPRVYELLPAILINLPEAIKYSAEDVPRDLAKVLKAIRTHNSNPTFRGVSAPKYLQWVKSPVMDVARQRLDFRGLPRLRTSNVTDIAQFLKKARIDRCFTQKQLAENQGLSLHVIRDLEQGKLTSSIENLQKILKSFNRRISIVE